MKSSKFSRSRRIISVIIISSIIYSQSCILPICTTSANPVYYWGEHVEPGGLLAINQTDYNLSMTYADVSMEIDARNFDEEVQIIFDGNYTIYNPNSTLSVIIGNPFQGEYEQFQLDFEPSYYGNTEFVALLNQSLKVYVDNNEIPTILRWMNSSIYYEWEEYFGEGFYPRLVVLSNITLRGYASTKLRYTWNTTITMSSGSAYTNFYYVVGTGRS
ncbi:MAG: hypothetical protein KGD64_14835, partial [Candidatus Heimdallarchaeota archaeon]|nr:hypothetical protein [Candidatus Heimdallarchaeota archaeon]